MTKKRKTFMNGKIVEIETGKNVYLGKDVKDIGVKGFSDPREFLMTMKEIEIDYNMGVIDRKQFNARLLMLKGIIEQTKKSKLSNIKVKQELIKALNKLRIKYDLKPLSLSVGPRRPTSKQIKASKRNIKKAQEARRKKL